MFVDEVTITVKAGRGGDGSCSFRREMFVPRGGPDGGDGGDGGDVILIASRRLTTLLDLRYQRHYEAEDGKPGSRIKLHGPKGQVDSDPAARRHRHVRPKDRRGLG
jgi:GTP-binding protein